ncbi:MAG TPA: chorismate synthase [Clostridiales bacterium]|nr:chorismate synthase [Clostridiales bacterium]
MNTFGENIRITIFGEACGPAIGVVLDGLPSGEEIDVSQVLEELSRKGPGSSEMGDVDTNNAEPVFTSGLLDGRTTGAPVCALIRNPEIQNPTNNSGILRPGHADLTARIKFSGFADLRGDGPFSGRLTSALVLAGSLCRQILQRRGISIRASIVQVGQAVGPEMDYDMKKEILDARASGDSVGSIVECVVTGAPAGLGGLMFGGMESRIAAMLFAIPGVRGVEFGAGFDIASMRGSHANDPICIEDDRVYTETNHSGGINGGITNGMPIVVKVALRPTPSISREQKTVDLDKGENVKLRLRGRHIPCLGPKAVPVVEAALAFCVLDAMED